MKPPDPDCPTCARLHRIIQSQLFPTMMSADGGRLIPINSTGMRKLVDENASLRRGLGEIAKAIEALLK